MNLWSTASSRTSRCNSPLRNARWYRVRSAGAGRPARRCRAARVDDDEPAPARRAHHPQEQDRAAVGHVGADHQEQVGVIEVLVRPGWTVGPQGLLVSGAGAGQRTAGNWTRCARSAGSPGQLGGRYWASKATSRPETEGHRIRPVFLSAISRNRRAVWVITSSRSADSRSAARSVRIEALSIRPGARNMSTVVEPFGAQPAEVGRWSGRPVDLVITGRPLRPAVRPARPCRKPTPQYARRGCSPRLPGTSSNGSAHAQPRQHRRPGVHPGHDQLGDARVGTQWAATPSAPHWPSRVEQAGRQQATRRTPELPAGAGAARRHRSPADARWFT